MMRGAVLAWIAVFSVGCEKEIYGPPTEAVCPQEQALTWENFGQKFMQDYCTDCHDSERRGSDRHGAPSFHDFDTVYGVRAVHEHIDETTAAGPASVNDGMPEDGPYPTLNERKQLGEWIACGMPTDEELAEMLVQRSRAD